MRKYTSPTRGDGVPCVPQDRLTVLRDVRGRAIGKHLYRVDNAFKLTKLKVRHYHQEAVSVGADLESLSHVLYDVSCDPTAFIVRDTFEAPVYGPGIRRLKENFPHRTSRFMPLDFDDVKVADVPGIPDCWTPGLKHNLDRQAVQAVVRHYLPEPFHAFPALAMFSASTGFHQRESDKLYVPELVASTVSFHLWYVLSEGLHGSVLKAWCTYLQRSVKAPVDPALYSAVQPIFCGPPTVHGNIKHDLPPIMNNAAARMVVLPAENCPTVCWGDERDHVPVRFILDSIPAPAPSRPAVAGKLARPTRAASTAARDADPALTRRLERYAQSTFKRLTEKLSGIEDKTIRHTALVHAARRLAGFAAVGLLDWSTVRAELAVLGRTSGTERALNYAEANPDDVSGSISDIRKSHQQQTTRRRGQRRGQRRTRPGKTTSRPVSVREGRNTLPGLIAAGMKRTEWATVLQQPPGLGKTTALRRWLRKNGGLYIFAAPNRRAAAEMVQQLREDGRRSEMWLGRDGPRLYRHQTWSRPGLQPDGETVQTCADERRLGRIRKGYRPFCGSCPFLEDCQDRGDSLTSGYVGQKRIAERMMKAGDGVLVITQDMLPAALAVAKRSELTIDGLIIDEQPRLQDLSLTAEDIPVLTRASPALGAVLGELLTRIGVETAEQDIDEMETMNPAARASRQAHGRIVSSIYQDALARLSADALEALPGLEEQEKNGQFPRGLLAMVRALAGRPGSVTVHARLGKPVALMALGERPDIPPGVPVIIADATADPRRIAAWAGRDVDVQTIRIRPHQQLRALLIESKGLQRGELGRQAGPVLHRRLQRIADEMESSVINIERERISRGLELSALVIHPMRLQEAHRPVLDAFLERLRQRGWAVSTTHWQSTESRGSDAYNGVGLVVTLGSPRLNLTGWAVMERGLASILSEPMPPDNPAADSRERVRWQREARAEMWQAHGRPRSFTDTLERPVLHVVVSPASDVPRALAELPPSQREHRSLYGRQAIAAAWLDAQVAERGLVAVHPGLMARIPGAPSVHSLKRACRQLFAQPRHWKCALTGGGRSLSVLSQDGVSSHAVATSLRRIADAAGLNHIGIKTPYKVYVSSFDPNSGRPPAAPQPARKRPPRTARGIEPALTLERAPALSDEGEPPPVKAINATEDGPPGALGSPDGERDWRTSKTPIEPPLRSNLDSDGGKAHV